MQSSRPLARIALPYDVVECMRMLIATGAHNTYALGEVVVNGLLRPNDALCKVIYTEAHYVFPHITRQYPGITICHQPLLADRSITNPLREIAKLLGINWLALFATVDGDVIDALGVGVTQTINTIETPEVAFRKDPLIILRLLYYSTLLNLPLSENMQLEIAKNRNLLQDPGLDHGVMNQILSQLFAFPYTYVNYLSLVQYGLFDILFPELVGCKSQVSSIMDSCNNFTYASISNIYNSFINMLCGPSWNIHIIGNNQLLLNYINSMKLHHMPVNYPVAQANYVIPSIMSMTPVMNIQPQPASTIKLKWLHTSFERHFGRPLLDKMKLIHNDILACKVLNEASLMEIMHEFDTCYAARYPADLAKIMSEEIFSKFIQDLINFSYMNVSDKKYVKSLVKSLMASPYFLYQSNTNIIVGLHGHERTSVLHVLSQYGDLEAANAFVKLAEEVCGGLHTDNFKHILMHFNTSKQSALHLAAMYGHTAIAELLLTVASNAFGGRDKFKFSKFLDARDSHGASPLSIATHYRHQDVVVLLTAWGAKQQAHAVPLGNNSRNYRWNLFSGMNENRVSADNPTPTLKRPSPLIIDP